MTQQEALDWIAEIFEESPGDLSPETHRTDVAAWDSLGVLTLMAELDTEFDIVLTEEDVQGMETVNDILDILKRQGKVA